MNDLQRRPGPLDQEALWTLLRRQVWRYTQGDHESIPVEIADGLLQSTLYTLQRAEETPGSLADRFDAGQRLLRQDQRRAQLLLQEARLTAIRFDNWSYRDTLQGLESFFQKYNPEFAAHETPVDIDYQLADPVPEGLSGVAYIDAYLRRLVLENRFVGRFARDRVSALLQASCPDPQGLLINLFEPVFQNALGHVLLGGPPRVLDMTRREQAALLALPTDPDLLARAAQSLAGQLSFVGSSMEAYLLGAARRLWPRLASARQSGDVSQIFLCAAPAQETGGQAFVDGIRMTDEALRALMQEMRPLELGPKVQLLQREVRSLADLADLLSACFYGEEPLAVFPLLSPAERQALLEAAGGSRPDWALLLRCFIGEAPLQDL